jgi:hypothetical protein
MAEEHLELEKVTPPDEATLVRPGYPRMGGYPDSSAYGYGYGEDDERAYVRRMWRAIKAQARDCSDCRHRKSVGGLPHQVNLPGVNHHRDRKR